MSKKKILLMVLLILVLLLSVVSGTLWHLRHYVLVEFQFYPRGVHQLDLREREVSVRHYEKLVRRMPDCEIQWNVPFQDTAIPCDAREITVSALTQKDIRNLEYFKQLETVKADNCSDYENLLKLWKQRPDLKVEYTVPLGTETFSVEAERVTLENATPEEIALLPYLPKLQRVLCSGGSTEAISLLQEY